MWRSLRLLQNHRPCSEIVLTLCLCWAAQPTQDLQGIMCCKLDLRCFSAFQAWDLYL